MININVQKTKDFIFELFRYVLVGGSAFIIDFLLFSIFNFYIFAGKYLYVSVFIGYFCGLLFNFFLSCLYVFKDGFKKVKNKEIQSFIIFTIIGLIGLLLTEIIMHIMVKLIGINAFISKMITSIIVMFWNYLARKVIIFK